jgi:hypothetical protein
MQKWSALVGLVVFLTFDDVHHRSACRFMHTPNFLHHCQIQSIAQLLQCTAKITGVSRASCIRPLSLRRSEVYLHRNAHLTMIRYFLQKLYFIPAALTPCANENSLVRTFALEGP